MTLPKLPNDFIWGVSASGWQSEGGNVGSNWDRYNEAAQKPGAETGGVMGPNKGLQDPYGRSVDFRHRYREDIALAKGLGCNTFRIGINWARVEPKEGVFDETELAYYDDVVNAMLEAGLAPLITLDHFVYPGWMDRQGGWVNPKSVTGFVRFSEMIARRYVAKVKWWLTFNEAAFMYMIEKKYRKLSRKQAALMKKHVVQSHRDVYDAIKRLRADAMVSSNIVCCGEGILSRIMQWSTDRGFIDRVADKLDYFAIDFYYRGIDHLLRAGAAWKADPAPDGLYRALKRYAKQYPNLPLMVAENGMPTLDNQPRPDGVTRDWALRECVRAVQRAKAEGVNVIGYMYWSLTDNFEWGKYGPRFGLYTVDVLTDPALVRKPTPAVAEYKAIIANGGVPDAELPGKRRA